MGLMFKARVSKLFSVLEEFRAFVRLLWVPVALRTKATPVRDRSFFWEALPLPSRV